MKRLYKDLTKEEKKKYKSADYVPLEKVEKQKYLYILTYKESYGVRGPVMKVVKKSDFRFATEPNSLFIVKLVGNGTRYYLHNVFSSEKACKRTIEKEIKRNFEDAVNSLEAALQYLIGAEKQLNAFKNK
jgi:hypothetical protein